MHIPKDQYWHEIKDNEFFIDRDPTHFRYILNYIRNNGHCILPNCTITRRELSIEANFYELHSLVTLLNYNKDLDGDGFVDQEDESVHIPSNLITKNECHLLTQWIEENDGNDSNELYSIDLLFRASEYDFDAKMFHDLCDYKGKTISIIQAENGYIFGGYTHFDFEANKLWKYHNHGRPKGFVFLLRSYGDDQNDNPRKWSLCEMNGNIQSEINSSIEYGPCFVDSIRICDKANLTEDNQAYIGAMFDDASNEQQQMLSGGVNFRVAEYEIFQVS